METYQILNFGASYTYLLSNFVCHLGYFKCIMVSDNTVTSMDDWLYPSATPKGLL